MASIALGGLGGILFTLGSSIGAHFLVQISQLYMIMNFIENDHKVVFSVLFFWDM